MELANKVGCAEIVGRIVDDLKDSKEDYRRMVMETIEKVREALGWEGGNCVLCGVDGEGPGCMCMRFCDTNINTTNRSQVVTNLGAADIDPRLEERLLDGMLYAFQEQVRCLPFAFCLSHFGVCTCMRVCMRWSFFHLWTTRTHGTGTHARPS